MEHVPSNIIQGGPGAETSREESRHKTRNISFQNAKIRGSKGIAMDINIPILVVIMWMKYRM